MLTIKDIDVPGYERVIEGKDPARGLHCFIAIHNTRLGPSLGGTRMHPYANKEAALKDVLLLAKAMTYKSAMAEDGLGGGKSVILADPSKEKNPDLFYAFAEVVDYLKGAYIAAEDVGTSPKDMAMIHKKTPYVCAMMSAKSSGDPSRFTAWGVFKGIQAVAMKLWKSTSLRNKTIAIQGLGHVGAKLADLLFWEGANLIVCDVKTTIAEDFMLSCGTRVINPESFCSVECDILAPCAMGEVINPQSLPLLRCKAIAGGANNQLSDLSMGAQLKDKGILYAPDYIINAGGIINAAAEFEVDGYDPIFSRDKVDHIYDILLNLFEKAEKENKPTSLAADEIAEYNLYHGIGKRKQPINFVTK
ncbi:MAG: Glu/Leu/Phe/Val dehydrogenase [Parachlamydiaceae bacterium]|nr:Glu/Leu/Phe/Val dehydrogenase [Parachlamydiaceae bacterium]